MYKKLLKIIKTDLISVRKLANKLKLRRDWLDGYLTCMKDMDMLEEITIGHSKVFRIKKSEK